MTFTKLILLIIVFSSNILANDFYKKPTALYLKQDILKVKEFQPYCSKLLNGECFIFSELYILGYSKNNFIAYVIKKALDLEDDGAEYSFIIQDLKSNKKIVAITYRYDSVSFDYFWKTKKEQIFNLLKKYDIEDTNTQTNVVCDRTSTYLKFSKVQHKDMFPTESFIKDVQVYTKSSKNKNIMLFNKKNENYIYTSQIVKCMAHPYSKQPIYILSSIQRGATGEPHLVILDIFGTDISNRQKNPTKKQVGH